MIQILKGYLNVSLLFSEGINQKTWKMRPTQYMLTGARLRRLQPVTIAIEDFTTGVATTQDSLEIFVTREDVIYCPNSNLTYRPGK